MIPVFRLVIWDGTFTVEYITPREDGGRWYFGPGESLLTVFAGRGWPYTRGRRPTGNTRFRAVIVLTRVYGPTDEKDFFPICPRMGMLPDE